MDIERLPIYKIIIERFIRSFRADFSNTIRMLSTFTVKDNKRVEFKDYLSSIDKHTFAMIFQFEEFQSPAMINFDLDLGYSIIDTVFGGTSKPLFNKGKGITMIDLTIMREIYNMVLDNLNAAWSAVHEIKASYVRSEINPEFIGIIPSKENVLVTDIEVAFGKVTGNMQIAVPMESIFPVRDKLI